VDALLHRADVFVHPATWEEAFGLTLVEAMASARPVIASRVGGIPEIVEDGVSGRLVTPGDPVALRAALDELVSSPELRERLAKHGRARVVERFSMDRCVRAHLDFLERFCRDSSRAPAPARQPVPVLQRVRS
jgi:glycosyltransferase involved in cell wall biosynthesis